MSKNKPDKEFNRLRHELDNEREKNQETRRQLKLKDNQLDTAEKLANKIKGQTFEAEIEILRKQLAISKETVRILKAHDKKAYEIRSQEFFKMMGNYKDVLHAFSENHPALARAFEKNHPATALAGDEVDHRNNQELGVLQINNSMQRMMLNDLKESNKEDAEEHEKEIKAISQKLKNVNENLANTTKSYDELLEAHNDMSKKYDDLVEATKERDSAPAQTTASDDQRLLEKHNDLTRDYAARVQEIDDLNRQHHEELDLYVEYLLKYVSPPKPPGGELNGIMFRGTLTDFPIAPKKRSTT